MRLRGSERVLACVSAAAHIEVVNAVHLIVQRRLHLKQSAGDLLVYDVLHPAAHHGAACDAAAVEAVAARRVRGVDGGVSGGLAESISTWLAPHQHSNTAPTLKS